MIREYKWLKERAKRFPEHNWVYNIMCFLYGVPRKKMTYYQVFLFFYALNKKDKKLDRELEDFAFAKTVLIYAFNHDGKIPEEILDMIREENKNNMTKNQ